MFVCNASETAGNLSDTLMEVGRVVDHWTTQPRGHHNKHVQEIWKTENNIFHVLSPIVTKYVCVVDGIEIGGDLP